MRRLQLSKDANEDILQTVTLNPMRRRLPHLLRSGSSVSFTPPLAWLVGEQTKKRGTPPPPWLEHLVKSDVPWLRPQSVTCAQRCECADDRVTILTVEHLGLRYEDSGLYS
jgi:hypothetical protein